MSKVFVTDWLPEEQAKRFMLNPRIVVLSFEKRLVTPMIKRYKMYADYLPPGAALSLVPDEEGTLVKWTDVKPLLEEIRRFHCAHLQGCSSYVGRDCDCPFGLASAALGE